MITKEAVVTSLDEAVEAQAKGANRIELCSSIELGGVTPSFALISLAKSELSIPIHVLIRTRPGDFCYTQNEILTMSHDIRICREAGVDGVVIGCLTKDGEIDFPSLSCLLKETGNMSLTFHMAFDESKDLFQSLEDIIKLGFNRILTRGGCPTAEAGKDNIKKLVELAGTRIIILAGKGVTHDNHLSLISYTGVAEVHGTRILN